MRSGLVVFTFFMVCLVVAAGIVMAQPMDLTKIKKVPRFEDVTKEQFEKMSDLFEEKPPGDPYVAFRVRLPEGWKVIADGASPATDQAAANRGLITRILGKVAHYRGPTRLDAMSRFEVLALELDYEISARNWFLNHILDAGFTLEGIEEVTDRRIEALYVMIDRDVPYVVRTVAEINGTRIVLASYYLPENHWEEEKAIQDRVIQSFHFISPEVVELETTRNYSFLNLLRFDYPKSWKLLAPNIFSIDGMDAKLINSEDTKTMTAEIEFHIISTELDTTLAQEVKFLREEMMNRGLQIGQMIDAPEDYKFHDHIFFNRVEVYQITDKTKKAMDHEYYLAIMVEDRYYYIITMLTPGRKANFYTWAKNTEAFEVVIESIRP